MAWPRVLSIPTDRTRSAGATWLARLHGDTSGNTLLIVAALLFPLLALVGGGIDMARAYMSQSRLQSACDAGTLAARRALGSSVVTTGVIPSTVSTEGAAYFNVNFQNGTYGTNNRTFVMTLRPDYSIGGVATVKVPTTIMRIFGFSSIDLTAKCSSQLNFNNTDVMLVLDTTGSMADTNPGDTDPKITVLKNVVTSFYNQLEGTKGPDTRIRFGFVPYSVNANVGALLQDNWVVRNWTYQSRKVDHTAAIPGTNSWTDNWVTVSGSYNASIQRTYAATYHPASGEASSAYYSCDGNTPGNTYTYTDTILSTTTQPWAGPPAGIEIIQHHKLWENRDYYWTNLNGSTCEVWDGSYSNLTRTYDYHTVPTTWTDTFYSYQPISQDVSNWRNETDGCMEERNTYEIGDYNNVDLTRALDLDLDTVPTPGVPATQWRPVYKNVIYERNLDYWGNGSFSVAPVVTDNYWMFQPATSPGLTVCPAPARKLAEMTSSDLSSYLNSLTTGGATYHDTGMIWGGRLISPTGLFASENADLPGKPTSRHLIFLTDGLTETYDIAYSAYGIEPLDQRRWSQSSALTLDQTVENRFTYACNEVKNHNVTVWVIGFGVTMNDLLKNCAGNGHWFQADNATQLNAAFAKIVASIGDLRITQ